VTGDPTFDVLPALDLTGGRLARLMRGAADSLVTRAGDPVQAARDLVAQGANWVHLVDLDAALSGEAGNLDLLARIATLPVRVEAGGGLSPAGVRGALERGATRAVLGASSLAEPDEVASAVGEFGPALAVGLDVRDERVAPRGRPPTGVHVADALALLAEVRPAFVVYTNVERDGMLGGPDLQGLRRVAEETGVPVLASGGIASLADLEAVARLAPSVRGAIVGRAIQDGRFTLREALAAVGGA
jgi:phosphoribosylformimino-5-aminoimidazole carboxamide ribonucleotide (ProFAR) isomerase